MTNPLPLMRTAAVMAAVLFCPLLGFAQAQPTVWEQLPPQLRDDQVRELAVLLDRWDQRNIELPSKEALRPLLRQRLMDVVRLARYPYQTTPWQTGILGDFETLPERVEPQKRLETSSKLVLVLLFVKGRSQYAQQSAEVLRQNLNLPLFLILGRAQVLAGTQPTIDPNAISRSLLSWWTTVWPFCD